MQKNWSSLKSFSTKQQPHLAKLSRLQSHASLLSAEPRLQNAERICRIEPARLDRLQLDSALSLDGNEKANETRARRAGRGRKEA
nr:hypothetical protein Itr_chr07CG02190 [Ipomoea trifida]